MDDLISRQAAIDAICKACANGDDYTACRDRDIKSRWCDNITALRDLPSAQPEIVRCKDCVYHAGWNYCEEVDGLWYDDDYCCRGEKGERRTDETD